MFILLKVLSFEQAKICRSERSSRLLKSWVEECLQVDKVAILGQALRHILLSVATCANQRVFEYS